MNINHITTCPICNNPVVRHPDGIKECRIDTDNHSFTAAYDVVIIEVSDMRMEIEKVDSTMVFSLWSISRNGFELFYDHFTMMKENLFLLSSQSLQDKFYFYHSKMQKLIILL